MGKILVVSVYYNQKEFLRYQIESFKKFFKDDFEFLMFDNSENGLSIKEEDYSSYEGFKYYRVPQNIFIGKPGGASSRAGLSLDYATGKVFSDFKDSNSILIVDSDVFPAKDFTFNSIMGDCDFSGISQVRDHVNYYANQLVGIRKESIREWGNFSFDLGYVDGVYTDCGGKLYYFMKDNPHIKKRDLDIINSMVLEYGGTPDLWDRVSNISEELKDYFSKDSTIHGGKSFSEVFADTFLHFRAGSNWIGFNENSKKSREENLFDFINKITK